MVNRIDSMERPSIDSTQLSHVIYVVRIIIEVHILKVSIGPYKDTGKRREEVTIHSYDTWNMDHTLAMIALPMLKQLKETKHGVPYVDQEDMPEHLQYKARQYDGRAIKDMFNGWNDFDHEFDRMVEVWDWIMDEMIWAMDQIASQDRVNLDVWYSKEYNKRLDNGLRLFGKYYRALWD